MVGGESPGRTDAGVTKVLRMLAALRQTEPGQIIYNQVEHMLAAVVDRQSAMEQAYLGVVHVLLDAYAHHLPEGSTHKVQLKLLQARLQPPLSESELHAVRETVAQYAERIQSLTSADTALFHEAVTPLLEAFGIAPAATAPEPAAMPARPDQVEAAAEVKAEPEAPAAAAQPLDTASHQQRQEATPATTEVIGEAAETQRDVEDLEVPEYRSEREWEAHELESSLAADPRIGLSDPLHGSHPEGELYGPVERRVDSVYRSHLDAKRRDIQKLQSTLAQRVLETITQNEEFGVLLEVVLGELHQVSDSEDLEELRWTLIREIEKLNKGHHELADKLDSTHHYLQLIESDSRQLSDELTRVRLLSLTDELTGLPNRRAFLRRLEDEVARVQRYGFPLSLALIDLDHFKQINDRYGHAGGDEVLGTYSKSILSIFRHHDLVARYGGEEFAVLLPNTDSEGAQRALTKVRKRAGESRWRLDDKVFPVPTFSAGVSLYKPGETVGAFIERADKALYRAKRLGRNRVEIDNTYQAAEAGPATESSDSAAETAQSGEES